MALLALVAALSAALGAADVSVTPRSQTLYSSISPKLRIQGEGFGTDASKVKLEFVPPLQTKLKAPMYELNVTEAALIVGLKRGFVWPIYDEADGTTLFLSSVKIGNGANVLEGPVPVAKIIAPPSVVKGEDKIVYTTGTKKFLINGTGFREGMALTFDPPLVRDVDYAMNVRSSTAVQLLLKTARRWRSEPGPLKLRRIDVGGGALRIDPLFGGVTVAEVQADLGGHGVTAEGEDQWVYQSAPTISVTGSGFEHARADAAFGPPKLRWGNGLKGRGVNYTTASFGPEGVVLSRSPGSYWRRNGASLPAPLILLAADAGDGFVGLGATEAKKGVRVATVFEDPSVVAKVDRTLFRTHSAQMWLAGRGFVRPGYRLPGGGASGGTAFTFDPPLDVGRDVLITIFNRTHALVRLREGRAWAAGPGPLRVTAVSTDPAGVAPRFEPKIVAMIAPDAEAHASGVSVSRSNHQVVYADAPTLTVSGSKLTSDAVLTFAPPLAGGGVDYAITRATSTALTLKLTPGRAWRRAAGPLVLKALKTASDADPLALSHGAGVVVADVVADPTVAVAKTPITASTTKRVSIRGKNFDLDGVAVSLEPTWAASFDVESVYEDEVVLKLVEGKAWTPSGSGVKYKIPANGVPLVLTKITTAAGEYVFRNAAGKAAPVQIATIVADDVAKDAAGEQLVCDDSCDWALDGVCDDGSRGGGGGGGDDYRGTYYDGPYWEDDDRGLYDGDDYGGYGDDAYAPPARRPGLSYGGASDDPGASRGGGGDDYGGGGRDGQDGAYYYGYEYDYEYFYEGGDYYGYYGDDFGAAACARGTDCTDCGSGVLGPNGAIPTWDDDYVDDADDAWFDDDADAWWDDDYDFGNEWTGFEDDGYGIGIIQSVDADKKPHPRHSGNHEDTHWFHKRKNKNGTEGDYEANFTYGFEIFFIGLFALVFGGLFYLSYLDSANKPNHPCAPCAASICPKSAATDDIEQLLGTKAAQD